MTSNELGESHHLELGLQQVGGEVDFNISFPEKHRGKSNFADLGSRNLPRPDK